MVTGNVRSPHTTTHLSTAKLHGEERLANPDFMDPDTTPH